MKSSLKRKNTVKESGLTDGKTRSQHGWRRCSKFQFIIQLRTSSAVDTLRRYFTAFTARYGSRLSRHE
ncbi:hypothetical protein ACET3Z_002451 [Daucus carota]